MTCKENVIESTSGGEYKQRIRPSKKEDIEWYLAGHGTCIEAAKHQEILACGVDRDLKISLSTAREVKELKLLFKLCGREPWQATEDEELFSNRLGMLGRGRKLFCLKG